MYLPLLNPHGAGAAQASLAYTNSNYPGHAGWKKVIVTGPAAVVLASSAPATDRSHELSDYPTDMLTSPPQDLAATVRVALPTTAEADSAVPAVRNAGSRAAAPSAVLIPSQPVHFGSPTHTADTAPRQLQETANKPSLRPQARLPQASACALLQSAWCMAWPARLQWRFWCFLRFTAQSGPFSTWSSLVEAPCSA